MAISTTLLTQPTTVLLIWTIAGIALARRFFRWNP